jgi:hypothetical protein
MFSLGIATAQNVDKAIYWYRKAADQGNDLGQFNLGILYYEGKGVSQDYGKAFHWINKAAKQGFSKACGQLGTMYIFGEGVAVSLDKAYQYSLQAAKGGDSLGFYNIGQFYGQGVFLEQNDIQAYAHYSISVNMEDPLVVAKKRFSELKARMTSAQIQAAEQEIPKLRQKYGLQ